MTEISHNIRQIFKCNLIDVKKVPKICLCNSAWEVIHDLHTENFTYVKHFWIVSHCNNKVSYWFEVAMVCTMTEASSMHISAVFLKTSVEKSPLDWQSIWVVRVRSSPPLPPRKKDPGFSLRVLCNFYLT